MDAERKAIQEKCIAAQKRLKQETTAIIQAIVHSSIPAWDCNALISRILKVRNKASENAARYLKAVVNA